MKTLNRISMAMIGISLLIMLWSAWWYIFFEPPTRAQLEASTSRLVVVSDAMDVHDVGFARIALAIIGLLILFIPYRKGERWAFAALAVLILCYGLPVFLFWSIPHLGRWQIFRTLPVPPVLGLATVYSYTHWFTALALVGLAIGVPYFITSRRNARIKEIQTP